MNSHHFERRLLRENSNTKIVSTMTMNRIREQLECSNEVLYLKYVLVLFSFIDEKLY